MADTKKNKVTYGLKNVHIWPITAVSDDGKPTYGAAFAWPGATEISLDAEGSSDPFYADDSTYFQGVVNNGYSGDLTSADTPEKFLTDVMGETVGPNGAHFEFGDTQPKEFAMAFEFTGDAKKRRHVFYRCKAERPSVGSSTKEDKISPNTPKVSITALPRLDNGLVKAWAEEGDKDYDDWYGASPVEDFSSIGT